MAVIFENVSRCAICNEVLDSIKAYTSFPPLIGNRKDPLFIFSDNAVHIDCLNKHLYGELALIFRKQYDRYMSSLGSKDAVDGQPIKDPRKIIAFGLLTSDQKEDLSKFNFLTLNRDNVDKWDQKQLFINTVRKFNREGKWEGMGDFNYLDYLVGEITK